MAQQQQPSGIMGAMANKQGNSADASLGGMAEAVDTKVEAYRNNPQALEKRLGNNQQLLDLLALQKVKSEKESAANQLLLSESQIPKTILAQREDEVLAMNKNEMAKQASGILGQRQKQQTKNMQRTAKGAAPKLAAASGGLLPLPRPNMQNMAQGGIIGYDGGGAVGHGHPHGSAAPAAAAPAPAPAPLAPDAETEAKLIAAFGKDYQSILAAMSSEARKRAVEALGIRSDIGGVLGGIADIATFIPRAIQDNYRDFKESPFGQAITGGIGYKKPVVKPKNNDPLTKEQLDAGAIPIPPVVKEDTPLGGVPPVGGGKNTVVPAKKSAAEQAKDIIGADQTAIPAIPTFEEAAGEDYKAKLTKDMNVDAQAGADKASERSDANIDRAGISTTMGQGITSLENLTGAAQDPEALKKSKRAAFFAAAGRGGIQGVLDNEVAQNRAEQEFGFSKLREITALKNEKIKTDISVAKIGQEAANTVYTALTSTANNAMTIVGNMSISEVQEAGKAADRVIQQNQQKIDNQLKIIDVDLEAKKVEILSQRDKAQAAIEMAKLLAEAEKEFQAIAAMANANGAELYQEQKQYERDKGAGKKMPMTSEEAAELASYVTLMDKIAGLSESFKTTTKATMDFVAPEDDKTGNMP